MKKFYPNLIFALVATTFSPLTAQAQIPLDYYSALKGKSGAALKTAVHNIIKKATVLDYGSGSGATWWGFYTTDNDNGRVIDRYSNETYKFGSQGKAVSGMNIEHSFPKSWWGGTEVQAYKDLFNLMPSDSKANSSKSNYGMGVVSTSTYDNGCIKVGKGTEGFMVWQPATKWEGDFARGYMYMATAYQDYTWTNEQGLNSLENGDYPTLKAWAQKLYISWAKEDAVSDTEVKRNEAVYKIQGNRNPFIDFPNLMEYIWGDSTTVAFDPTTTVKSSTTSGTIDDTDPGQQTQTIYSATYTSADGSCTTADITLPSALTSVWQRSSKYGWTGAASVKSGKTYTYYAAEGTLATPEIDLTNYASATLSFTHALNFCTSPASYMSVEVLCNGATTKLDGVTWPSGSNWTFVSSGDLSLDQFAGKKIQIVFRYTSTSSVCGTWEIKDINVSGTTASSGIEGIEADNEGDDNAATFNPSQPYEVFNTAGQRISTANASEGVVIVRQNGHSWKVKK